MVLISCNMNWASVSDITPEAALAKLAYVLAKNEWSHGQKRKEQNT